MQLRARGELHLTRKPFKIGPRKRRLLHTRQNDVRIARAQVRQRVHDRRRPRNQPGVHDRRRARERTLARDPRDEPVARPRQKGGRVGLRKRLQQLGARLVQRLLRRMRQKAVQDLHRLVQERRMLEPVHRGGVERRRIPETHRPAHRLRRMRAHGRIRQRIHGQLRGEIQILVLAGIELAREILLRRHAGVEVAQLSDARRVGPREDVLLSERNLRVRPRLRQQGPPRHDRPPQRRRGAATCETATHADNGDCAVHTILYLLVSGARSGTRTRTSNT